MCAKWTFELKLKTKIYTKKLVDLIGLKLKVCVGLKTEMFIEYTMCVYVLLNIIICD